MEKVKRGNGPRVLWPHSETITVAAGGGSRGRGPSEGGAGRLHSNSADPGADRKAVFVSTTLTVMYVVLHTGIYANFKVIPFGVSSLHFTVH